MPSFPTLSVRDVVESSRWYCDNLGFDLVFQMPGPNGAPILTHLRWAKYADLLLVPDRSSPSEPKGLGITLNFAMGGKSIDDFSDGVAAKVVTIDGPVDQPWNARELTIRDPDGYRLTFTQPIRMDLSIEDVTDSVNKMPLRLESSPSCPTDVDRLPRLLS